MISSDKEYSLQKCVSYFYHFWLQCIVNFHFITGACACFYFWVKLCVLFFPVFCFHTDKTRRSLCSSSSLESQINQAPVWIFKVDDIFFDRSSGYIRRVHVCVCVYPDITLTFLHALPSNFTDNLILTGRFSHAFWTMLPFLLCAVLLKLIQATLPLFQPPLFWPHCLVTSLFRCSNSDCQEFSG